MSAPDIYAYALKLLTRKNYFVQELRQTLAKKYPDESPEPVIESLKQDRYLDDARQLAAFVRWKATQGYGPYYMKEKLRSKGVDVSTEEIKKILEEDELNPDEIVLEAVRKYKKTRKNKDREAFIRGCLSYLAYRGFSTGDVIGIVKKEAGD